MQKHHNKFKQLWLLIHEIVSQEEPEPDMALCSTTDISMASPGHSSIGG